MFQLGGKPLLLHSCGSIYELIPDLIEIGIDAINPVQVRAANMDSKKLKREFGKDLTFWGEDNLTHVFTAWPLQVGDQHEGGETNAGAVDVLLALGVLK